jgi:nucleoside-triphosphatase THEP1
MIALVTGDIGSGKTTACQKALALLAARGITCRGLLAPARYDPGGEKNGIDLLDVATGERRRLADTVPGGGATIGRYTFDPDALQWGLERLEDALRPSPGLLVVDEIGPLEILHGGGFALVLDPLADPARVAHALVIVRRQYLGDLQAIVHRTDQRTFQVTPSSRNGMPARIAEAFGLAER